MDVDVLKIQRLAGHEDITTTMRYIKASDENLREAVDLLASKRPLQIGGKNFSLRIKQTLFEPECHANETYQDRHFYQWSNYSSKRNG